MKQKNFSATPAIPEQVATHVQNEIIRGALAPGERISEARLTAELGVSRGSVREALRLLTARHLVEFAPRRGASVSLFGADDVRELYDLQMSLLTLLVERVAERWGDSDRERFSEFRQEIDAAVREGDPPRLLALAWDFQLAACAIVANPFLTDTLERLYPAFSRAHYRALATGPGERLKLAQFVDELLSAVMARDRSAVGGIVRRYGRHQRDVVLATFEEQPLVDGIR